MSDPGAQDVDRSDPATAPAASSTEQEAAQAGRKAGPWLLWFAVLGGGMAWALHLMVGWGVVEVACTRGHTSVAGLPLRGLVTISTAGPGLVVLLALWLSWRLRSRYLEPDRQSTQQDRSVRRASFMAEIALWTNGLCFLMILMSAVAIAVFPPCST